MTLRLAYDSMRNTLISLLFQVSTQCSFITLSKNGAKIRMGPSRAVLLCLFPSTICRKNQADYKKQTFSKTNCKPDKLKNLASCLPRHTVESSMSLLGKVNMMMKRCCWCSVKFIKIPFTATQDVIEEPKQNYARFSLYMDQRLTRRGKAVSSQIASQSVSQSVNQ